MCRRRKKLRAGHKPVDRCLDSEKVMQYEKQHHSRRLQHQMTLVPVDLLLSNEASPWLHQVRVSAASSLDHLQTIQFHTSQD